MKIIVSIVLCFFSVTAFAEETSLNKKNKYACEVKKNMWLNPFPYLQYEGAHGSLVDFHGDGTLEFYDNGRKYWENKSGTDNLIYSKKKTVIDSKIETVSTVWLRKVAVADINADGKDDLFLLGHGWDAPPFPGEKTKLLLSHEDGYKSVDPKLGVGFWHSGSVGDLNNDGLPDLLAVKGGKGINSFALQNKSGEFEQKKLQTGYSSKEKRLISGEIFDADGDGNLDLIVSTATSKIIIFWGDGNGSFPNKSTVRIPKPFIHVVDINFGDLDGNKKKEVLLLATQGHHPSDKDFYKGFGFMSLGVIGRKLSKPLLLASNKKVRWFPWIYVCDLDNNGKDDVFSFVVERTLKGKKTGEPAFKYSQ